MKIRFVECISELIKILDFSRCGIVLEDDLDVINNSTEFHDRKLRDAEVLCTLAANVNGDVLELGTSHGRGAFKFSTNIATNLVCHTVNILPDQYDASGGKMITHLISKEDIGS